MKRIISVLFVVLLVLGAFAGCGKSDGAVDDGRLHYADFAKVQIGMTEEECYEILGQPEREDKAYKYYTAVVNGVDCELEVWIDYESHQVSYRRIDCYKREVVAEFADSNVDLSRAKNLKDKTVSTYAGCAKLFGGEGVLISEDEKGSKSYLWVAENGGYLKVDFNSKGAVQSYYGFV